uniref:FTH domain-containing protein n=1 Tax=Rhabditophanes sp. KR3021 TaxID=114890 RepID=A0AC35TH49_9BILA
MLTPAQFVLGNSLIMSNVFSNLPNIKDRMQVEQSCKWFKYVSSGTHYFTSNPLVDSTLTVDVTIDTVKISIADNHFQITFNSNKNIKKQVTDFMEPFLCRVHRQIRRLLLIRNFIHLDDSLEEGLDYLYKLILESAKKLEIIHFDKCNFYSSPHLVTLDETVKSNSAQTIRFTQCEFSESDSECLKIAFSQLDRLTTIQIQPSHCSSSLDFLLLISNTNCRATNISIIENSCHDLRTEDAIEYSQEIVAK